MPYPLTVEEILFCFEFCLFLILILHFFDISVFNFGYNFVKTIISPIFFSFIWSYLIGGSEGLPRGLRGPSEGLRRAKPH